MNTSTHLEEIAGRYLVDRSVENRNSFIEAVLPVIGMIARRRRGQLEFKGIPVEDAVSEAVLQVLDKIESWKVSSPRQLVSRVAKSTEWKMLFLLKKATPKGWDGEPVTVFAFGSPELREHLQDRFGRLPRGAVLEATDVKDPFGDQGDQTEDPFYEPESPREVARRKLAAEAAIKRERFAATLRAIAV